ncbi:putative vps9 domain protein [Golovinomyces cichoracearum]|uniref:Putative vps9 domain protein n=1 Tax=Golovinomyces cichoracearum TaxID=62708 RepID=A0A420IS93_9PEZI|nr:putative vps9 domain protein [Golovinomyces cichoracearum]
MESVMSSSENWKCESEPTQLQHEFKSIPKTRASSSEISPQILRTNSLQLGTTDLWPEQNQQWETDTFERDPYGNEIRDLKITENLSDGFDKLPIELASLSDNFIESLSAKVHPSPPSVDKLSGLFQDFYEIAINHINTHVSTLSVRHNPQSQTIPTLIPIRQTGTKLKSRKISADVANQLKPSNEKECLEQQMLTSEEIADRREARRKLEYKRIALEEAVERKVCEATYDRIWRHRSTHDEERDEKLRSRTAALSLVGIGLRDLGVDLGDENNEKSATIKEKEVAESLAEARKELCAMNDLKYPLGKLQHLKAAHKAIVETLSHFHPSSSADEIMPMLIYTLITSRPEGTNIMSNLYFIQRFRNENKIDGEAAYCLTNLEAAISFLETVDLASLRADEVLSGPPKSASRTCTPSPEIFDPLINPLTPSTSVSVAGTSCASPNLDLSKGESSPKKMQNESQGQSWNSNIPFQQSTSLGVGNGSMMNSTDQGLESIGNSIGDSYKFLLAKIKGRQEDEIETRNELTVKSLEDSQNSIANPSEDGPPSSIAASFFHNPIVTSRMRSDSGSKIEERIFSMIGGRKTPRDKSSDSNKRVSFAEDSNGGKNNSPLQNLSSANPALVESMRNLGNSLNPMNRISGIGMMRAFGRSTPPATPTATSTSVPDSKDSLEASVSDLAPAFPDLSPALSSMKMAKVAPPLAKFLELQTPGDMKLNEAIELLRDYKRLANVLKELGVV